MSKQKMQFGENVVNKKDFYSCKFFIGHSNKDKITPLCIILPQMSGFIKYFEDGGKNMSFKIEDKSIYLKFSEIWNKIRTFK